MLGTLANPVLITRKCVFAVSVEVTYFKLSLRAVLATYDVNLVHTKSEF